MPTIGDKNALAAYVQQRAPGYGLDPLAVLAVASREGIGGGIGDNGTSFGPWQLHYGGALPAAQYGGPNSQKTQAWAWSPAGIDYALGQMGQVARGLRGAAAVQAIVYRFERPADPASEAQAAVAAYGGGAYAGAGTGSTTQAPPRPDGSSGTTSDAGLFSGVTGFAGGVLGGAEGFLGGIFGGVGDVASAAVGFVQFVLWFFQPRHIAQAVEFLVGVGLIFLGLVWLGREHGGPDVDVAAAAAKLTPAGRAASLAKKAPKPKPKPKPATRGGGGGGSSSSSRAG